MNAPFRAPQLQALFASGKVLTCSRGEHIGSTNENSLILFVLQGYIKRYMIRNDGGTGIQIIYGPQDVFSLTRVFNVLLGQSLYDGPENYYYDALSGCTLFSLGVDAFAAGVRDNPHLYRELFSEAGHHLKACIQAIENTSLHTINTKVAHQLAYLFGEFGEKDWQGTRLRLALTHQDIADMLGVTRASVTLAINQLREKGLLLSERHLVTTDPASLARAAYEI